MKVEQHTERLRVWSRIAAGIAAALASIALLGWAFDFAALATIWPGFSAMAVATASCFILGSISLFLITRDEDSALERALLYVCLAVIISAGVAAVTQYVLGVENAGYLLGPSLGTTAAATALNFVLFSAALFVDGGANGRIYGGLIAAGLSVSWLCLVGYAYGVEALYAVSSFSGMALGTAIAFVALFVGAALARPQHGWTKYLVSADSGGAAARFLLPAVILVPFALAGVMIPADRLFSISAPFGFALLAVISTIAFAAIVCFLSQWLSTASEALKQVNESLVESEQTARMIVDTALDAFVQMDETGSIVEWNPQAEKLFGWRRDEAVGKTLSSLIIPAANRVAHAEGLARFLRTGESAILGKRIEINAAQRSGREITVELTVTAMRRKLGYVFNGFIRDRTQKIAIESQLRQAQKMEAVGQLTGGVAHDFNNLLAVIIGSLDSLEATLQANPKAQSLAGMALKAALRGADLTRQLLVFSRRQSLQAVTFDLNDRVAGTVELLRRTLGESVDIRFDPADGLWPVLCDAAQLEAALANLAINARDAMPDGGCLTIETANLTLDSDYTAENIDAIPGDYLMLAVSDTGTGMPREILERVFEPFFTTKPEGKGSGLGLSMVYGFAKQSRGHVKIYSEVGHGTTVRLYLPRSDVRVGTPDTQPAEPEPAARSATILVVEDNADVRAVAVRQLLDLGYHAVEAENGKAAIEILKQDGHIDLLFTDVVMPGGITGDVLAREARTMRPGIKVLFTSGFAQAVIQGIGNRVSEVGQENLLGKPYRKQDLARRIHEALHGKPQR